MYTPNRNRSRIAVGGTAEIQVGLDGAEVLDDVRPRPAGYPVAVEVAPQTAAEVSAVDRTRAADRGAPHDRDVADGSIGQSSLVALDQRARGANRQPQPIGGLGAQCCIGQADTGLQHSDHAARVGRNTIRDNGSSASRADDQHVAVQRRNGQGLDSNLRLQGTDVAFPH